jgi:hypothetical protein
MWFVARAGPCAMRAHRADGCLDFEWQMMGFEHMADDV